MVLDSLSPARSDVSISRARERARIYTDDAELLRRRVEDTHTRKAAVELEGLREALRRAGYTRTPTPAPAMRPDSPRASVAQSVGRAWRHVCDGPQCRRRKCRVPAAVGS